jgi:hypothetical protein
MIDLEQEFQLLMRTVVKQIEDKVATGELTRREANDLITMVNLRTVRPTELGDEGWSQSTISCMEAANYMNNYDGNEDAWSGSSVSC